MDLKYSPGGQIGPVGGDTLLLYHEAYVVKGAGLEKVVPNVG
jgi:hypothetical protein